MPQENDIIRLSGWIASKVNSQYKKKLAYNEVFAEAYYLVIQAAQKYDPDKGSFSNYVYKYCFRDLMTWARKEYEAWHKYDIELFCDNSDLNNEEEDFETKLFLDLRTPETHLFLKETIESLPELSKIMLKILCDSPSEILMECKGSPAKVRSYLVSETKKRTGLKQAWIYRKGLAPIRRAFS